jgi:hypothetical protein
MFDIFFRVFFIARANQKIRILALGRASAMIELALHVFCGQLPPNFDSYRRA